jgi:hypothetical protein
MSKFEKGMIIKMSGLSVKKENGVFETSTGKELYSTKSNGTLQDAKAYVSLMIKKQIAS